MGKKSNRWDKIDQIIHSGRYNRIRGDTEYSKCNLFTDDMARSFWGVNLPRMKHSDYFMKGAGKDWPENPMGAAALEGYYESRGMLPGSGVRSVDHNKGRQIANLGGLVLALGGGHATIMAPNDREWPLIYRSDLSYRGDDKRTRVGMKNPEALKYYYIVPGEYNRYNKWLKSRGYSQRDIHEKFNRDGEKVVENPAYYSLHKGRIEAARRAQLNKIRSSLQADEKLTEQRRLGTYGL